MGTFVVSGLLQGLRKVASLADAVVLRDVSQSLRTSGEGREIAAQPYRGRPRDLLANSDGMGWLVR
jgi:hypothetical protein